MISPLLYFATQNPELIADYIITTTVRLMSVVYSSVSCLINTEQSIYVLLYAFPKAV